MKSEMQPGKSKRVERKPDNSLELDQCRLYKIGSEKRLAEILGLSLQDLRLLLRSESNYKKFTISQSENPFTKKPRKKRAVQVPMNRLRRVHAKIFSFLRRVKYPDYVQGAVKGRSYQTNAAFHARSRQTATFDISKFYESTKYHLVHEFFLGALKCPTDIAGKLARLVTCDGVMPTGSLLSPLLSFWVAKGMFDECAALAETYDLKFTCYIDDLTFSGDRIPRELKSKLKIIVSRYGYKLAMEKTKVFRFGAPAHITGVVKLNGELVVPFARLMAARRISDALDGKSPDYGYTKNELKRKLAGTIAEAATIDGNRFSKWAAFAQKEARD
ncbi:TPA: RNA-directed DNA polymerase [Pseudomonas aeruginosa]|uniref:reverse transcriptase family protein n=1 Tax=Pseudomonas aeruginosa TaxID=287 RepID=UPI0029F34A00|nr:RNA-directed DNA polymerase [Pseudomonas aeruginosa]HEJ9965976.1 RNA-directed DNA polymerase [Pseudomonas aeruginosa]